MRSVKSKVSVLRAPASQVQESVREAMEMADWKSFVSPNATIALKPNLGWDVLIPGAISAPWVVEGVIQVLQGYAKKIYLVESDQVVVNVEKSLKMTRLDRLCDRYGVEWVNMSRGPFVRVKSGDGLALKEAFLPEILTQVELVTLPVMKTHNKTTISGAIKNQWGCLQALRHNYHLVLSQALVDVNKMVRPRFAVMDATVGLEGNGPKSGTPKEMGLVLAGGDLVAVDTVAGEIMGFDSTKIEHLQLAASTGLGTSSIQDIEIVGTKIADVQSRFQPARHNAVSFLELVLRESRLRPLMFQTPLFGLMCWGARRYYEVWQTIFGRSIQKRFMANSSYADQWR